MQLNEYQTLSRKTAVYPENEAITYPLMGLVGEAGEAMNKAKKVIRDHGGDWTQQRDALQRELGDCAWYLASAATDMKLTMGSLAVPRQRTPGRLIVMPLAELAANASDALLCFLLLQAPSAIVNYLSVCLSAVREAAMDLGSTMDEVLVLNLAELAGRKQRGTIHGSGDVR